MKTLSKKTIDACSYDIIGAAIRVHRELGPGLLEQVYSSCRAFELRSKGMYVESERAVQVTYRDHNLDTNLRCDLLVENCVVVEAKAVQQMHPVFEAQLLTYMRLLKIPKGLLLNFFCSNLVREGQKTLVNELYRNLSD